MPTDQNLAPLLPPDDETMVRLLRQFQPSPGPQFKKKMDAAPWSPARKVRVRRRWRVAGALAFIILMSLLTPLVVPSFRIVAQKMWNFFTLTTSDQMQLEITLPNDEGAPIKIKRQDLDLSIEEAEALADYDLMLPAFEEADLTFQGAWYGDGTRQTAVFFQGRNRSLLFIQQPAGVAYQEVGSTAQVESVQIGPVNGEYVIGGWVVHTPAATLVSATPGTPVSVEVHWDPSISRQTLRWEIRGMIFEIIAWGDFSKTELIALASSVSLP